MRKRGPHLWIPFLTILTAGLACATAVVGASLRRWDHRLRPADWITLSRAGVAMLLLARAGTSRRTAAMDWLAWTGLLAGATVLDWLDGPLARRHGPTGWGTTADLEADSWLTFVGSVSAVAAGELPPLAMFAPAARYPLVGWAAARGDYREANLRNHGWPSLVGGAQMAALIAATSPLAPPWLRSRVHMASVVVAPLQMATLLYVYGRVRPRSRPR